MAEHRIFRGFFSYAHYDAVIDPGLIAAFTTNLERRVNGKLANARFTIWRDEQGLRTGELWDDEIGNQLRNSDLLIVLVTPRWIESEYCRREYSVFEEIESQRAVGEYIAPILARSIEEQYKYLTPVQQETHARIARRQYFKAFATDFLALSLVRRNAVIDEIADDIAGMIERLRAIPGTPELLPRPARLHPPDPRVNDSSSRAEDYAEVDFLRSVEVLVDKAQDARERGVYAQVDFVERLFIKNGESYIEFGITRAYLSVYCTGAGQLLKYDDFRVKDTRAAYVTLRDIPEALTVAMNAESGKALAELALPPMDGNYWSRIASATWDVQLNQLRAELRVSFSAYGLYVSDENPRPLSQAAKRKIEAILSVAIDKNERILQDGQVRRVVPLRERTP